MARVFQGWFPPNATGIKAVVQALLGDGVVVNDPWPYGLIEGVSPEKGWAWSYLYKIHGKDLDLPVWVLNG